MKAFALYTGGRVLIFAAIAATLYLAGLRSYLLFAAALLISVPVSYVLLQRQRAALTAEVERRMGSRRERKGDLRARLRGDDDT